eukprot:gene12127-14827_t
MKPLFEPDFGPAGDSAFQATQQYDDGADTVPDGLPQSYPLRIEFTGSGSEYFRIWVVNLLLLLVTVGIYYPWAK